MNRRTDLSAAELVAAFRLQDAAIRETSTLLDRYAALLTPTVRIPAPPLIDGRAEVPADAEVPGTPAPLTFARSGYETFTTTVSVRGDEAQTFRLIPKATVNIRTSAGASYDVDPETVEFGYVAPFTGYNKDTKLNLCKGGGESFMPDRTEIKRITGAAQLNDPKCCAQFSIPAINVELKSGGTTTAGFVDACFGYKVDIVAQDHVTALPVYFHFTDLAEVTFP